MKTTRIALAALAVALFAQGATAAVHIPRRHLQRVPPAVQTHIPRRHLAHVLPVTPPTWTFSGTWPTDPLPSLCSVLPFLPSCGSRVMSP
jgi:hypothetical protein